MDCKHGIINGIDVYPANNKESLLILRHLEKQQKAYGLTIDNLVLDGGMTPVLFTEAWSYWASQDIFPQ